MDHQSPARMNSGYIIAGYAGATHRSSSSLPVQKTFPLPSSPGPYNRAQRRSQRSPLLKQSLSSLSRRKLLSVVSHSRLWVAFRLWDKCFFSGHPVGQTTQAHIEHGRQNKTEKGHADHAAEHRGPHGVAHFTPRSAGQYQRSNAGDKCITQAALEASRLRLRPIIMTSVAFIAGVAPLANTRGVTPAINATEVIMIGRRRKRLASRAAWVMLRPCCSRSRANSTIRMAFLHANPINTTSPTCTKILLSPPVNHTPTRAAKRHSGTINTIARGRTQLSYSAARTKKTNSAATGKTINAAILWLTCSKLKSVHSNVMPSGKVAPDVCATMASA